MHSLEVLSDILRSAQLERPDPDKALWKYPVAEQHLADLLREFIAVGEVPMRMSAERKGALALLVANLLCERLSAGAWKWQPVFDALEWQPSELDKQRFREHVGEGLERYWGRRVRVQSGDREYLGSLIVEGGLPLSWLSSGGAPGVQRLLQRLVRLVERHGISAEKLIDEHLDLLPETLRKESDIAALLARMADALVALRKILPAGCESPADYLDGADPQWRHRLPLPKTRIKGADAVINGLLATASEATHGSPVLVLDWRLIVDSDRLVREVVLPDRIASDALARELGRSEDALPPLLYLTLASSGGRQCQLARLERRQSTHFNVVPSGPPPHIEGADEWRCTLSANGVQYGVFLPVGGEALESHVPWIFDDHNRTSHVLLTCGSCELRHDTLIVALPADAPAPLAADDNSLVERIDNLSARHRTYYRVLGTADASVGDEQFTLAGDRAGASAPIHLRLHGRRLSLGTARTMPFWGAPTVSAHDGEQPIVVPTEEVQWRPSGDCGGWRPWSHSRVAGDVTIRWRRGGVIVGRVVATILPADFSLASVKCAAASNLRLTSGFLENVTVLGEFPAIVERAAPGDYRISATEQRPSSAELRARLLFAGGCAADVRLPIPSAITGFVGVDGLWLTRNAQFSLSRTDTLRARGAGHAEFQLDARLRGGSAWQTIARTRADDSGWAELCLDLVREQLEPMLWCPDLDRIVELIFCPLAMPSADSARLHLAYYGLSIGSEAERDAAGAICGYVLRVVNSQGQPPVSDSATGEMTIRLLSLTQPWLTWASAERLDANSFRIEAQRHAPGPHLAVVFTGASARSRPKLLAMPGTIDTSVSAIAPIATELDYDRRQLRWRELIDAMANDFEHRAWPELQRLVGAAQAIPAPTFEWLRLLAEHPGACAMAILRQRGPDHQREMLHCLAQLGVMPQALPLAAWLRSLRRIIEMASANASALGGLGSALALVAGSTFGAQRSAVGMVGLLRCVAARHYPGVPLGEDYLGLDTEVLTGLLQREWQGVLQRHGEDQWPQADTTSALSLDCVSGMPVVDCLGFQSAVQRAPAVAAAIAFFGKTLPPAALRQLRRLRLFDRDWFDMSHSLHLTLLVRRHPEVVKGYFDGS